MTDQTTDVEQLAASLVNAKEQMEVAKDALDDAKRAYGKLEAQMAEAMATADKTVLKASGRFVSVRTTYRWSVPKESKEAVVGLLKTHRPDMVKETVHSATLNKLAEEMRTAEAPLAWWGEVDGLLSMSASTAVKVTKSKPKS
jgi:hypothetical protein